MRLPQPRGPLSTAVAAALRDEARAPVHRVAQDEEDLHVALWMLYEQHYRGFDDVDPALEWDPDLLAVRAHLERPLEATLRRRVSTAIADARAAGPTVVEQLEHLARREGAGMPEYLHRDASREEYEAFLRLRSVYYLKESDPHTWALPRISGAPKAALAELLYDEFGGGSGDRVHQVLFEDALRDAGLDPTYGAYVDEAPAHVLAVSNAMSFFALHRRLRGAAVGHLAAFEMTSSLPCRRYVQGAERLGLPGAARYFAEHVEADAVHEQIAARGICAALVAAEPELLDDVLLGAATAVLLEHDSGVATLADWAEGRSGTRQGRGVAVA